MKKILSVMLSFVMVVTMLPTFAISAFADDEPSYVGPNDSDHAYLDIHTSSDDYSFYFMGNPGDAELEGVDYDYSTNTLVLVNYNDPNAVIEASEMGSDFKITLIGENHIKAITVFADRYMGSLTMVGEGSIYINENKESKDVPLYLDANESASVLNINDTVHLWVYANDDEMSIKVLNSTDEEPIVCANTEYCISSWEESSSQSRWINANNTQTNTFWPVKDSDSYTTLCWDEFAQTNVYYEFTIINKNIDGKDIVFANPTIDDMGNPIIIPSEKVDSSNTIVACQIMNSYERAAVEKADDDTEYALTEYTIDGEGPFWDVYKVIHDEDLGNFFYPVSVGLTEKPTEYTVIIDTINNNFKYIENDFDNNVESPNCEHFYVESGVVIAPTCEKDGVMAYTCNLCGNFTTDGIPATGHKYKTTTTKSTTTTDGKKVTKCSVCGKIKSTATIKKVSNIKLGTTKYTYDGKVKSPTLTVKDSAGKTLVKGTDYTVTVPTGRKNVGKYTYKITFKGNYSGTKSLSFTIVPKSTSISSLTAVSKGFTVKWKKQATQTTGYQIQIATDSGFTKGVKSYTVTSNSTVSKKITKLTAKKKYYVRIRTYKTVSGTKYYSSWSASKTVTTKK